MNFWIVTRHFPTGEGTAAGRILLATCEGLRQDGHQVAAVCWAPERPPHGLPDWCSWRPIEEESHVRSRLRSLFRPRTEVARLGLTPPEDAVAVADEPLSFAAVSPSERSVVTVHYSTLIDRKALGRMRPRDVQDLRNERRAVRDARAVLAYSQRIADGSPRAAFVPAAYPVPAEPVTPVAAPVAALVASWDWPANRIALRRLLALWPSVSNRLPHAELILAGRGLDAADLGDGVKMLGAVERASDVLARAAVVAFPCPDTSGPKVKTLEALSYGIPVVTTPAGAEGIAMPELPGMEIASDRDAFSTALAGLLADPARRARMGAGGRAAVSAAHGPLPAARARVAALTRSFGDRLRTT